MAQAGAREGVNLLDESMDGGRDERGPRWDRPQVTFFIAGGRPDERLDELDPDRDLASFRLGERAWVVQTFLRLRRAGYPVELADRVPRSGLVVFHAKQKRALARAARGRRDLVFVGIRADNSSPLLADFEVLQNGRFADGRRRFAIPHWPQPGLLPRDPSRGARFERLGYVGLHENLHPDFRDEAWPRALAALGMEWVPKVTSFREVSRGAPVDWEDYRALDAVLAVRPGDSGLASSKPASKLVNAWRAGIPALLGAEYPFRELRRCELDYVEVADGAGALAALTRLRDDPARVRRMVAHGRQRATEFDFPALTLRWAELLFETLPGCIRDGGLPWSHRLPIGLRLPWRRLLRAVTGGPRR